MEDLVRGTIILVQDVPATIAGGRMLRGLEQILLDAYPSLKPVGYNSIRAIAKQNRDLKPIIDEAVTWLRSRPPGPNNIDPIFELETSNETWLS